MRSGELLQRLELKSGLGMKVFLGTYVLLFLLVGGLLLYFPKAELHLMLNSGHNAYLDTFFRYYSTLAEWPFYVLMLLPLALGKKRWVLFYAACEILSTVITTAIKYIWSLPRPSLYFQQFCPGQDLPLVDGVKMLKLHSFPSGHTATFFIFFVFWGMLMARYYSKQHRLFPSWSKRCLQQLSLLLMLVLACLGGFSRIYLSQHFLVDVWAGSLIGILCVGFIYARYAPQIEKP